MLLIDGDILVYKLTSASTCWKLGPRIFGTKTKAMRAIEQGDPSLLVIRKLEPFLDNVFSGLDRWLAKIQEDIKGLTRDTFVANVADVYQIVLSPEDGVNNFRHAIAKTQPYKGNRTDISRPFYFKEAREYLIQQHKAKVTKGQEADDELGILQCSELATVICSTDKDLKTRPGWNYNWDKKALTYIHEWEAEYNFYYQMLCGDTADNIKGIAGIGPIRAEQILVGARNPVQMLGCVIEACMEQEDKTREEALDYVNELGGLLRIRREPNEIWTVEEMLNGN